MQPKEKSHRDLIPQSKFTVISQIKSSAYGIRTPRRSHSRLPDLLAIGQQQEHEQQQHEQQLPQQLQLELQQPQLPQEKHFLNHQVAVLDILEGDAFGQLVIELVATPARSLSLILSKFSKRLTEFIQHGPKIMSTLFIIVSSLCIFRLSKPTVLRRYATNSAKTLIASIS